MGVGAFKDKKGRTRYRVTFSRDSRRLVDERLPPGTSKDQADEFYAKVARDWFNRERLGIEEIPLISAVIKDYEERVKPRLKSPRFFTHCVQAIAPHVLGKTLDQLHEVAEAVQKALAHQAPATIAHRVRFVRMLGRYALKRRMVKIDHGAGIEPPPFNNERQFYIDKRVMAQILRYARKPVRMACWQLFYTGMRRGELYAANVTADAYVIPETKNGEPRIVPIPDPVRKFAGNPKITRNPLSKAFKRAAVAAGYPHLHLHDLRHSTASQLLNAGADLGVVGMILGHRSAQSTRRYAHLATATARRWLNFAAKSPQVIDPKAVLSETREAVRQKKRA